MQNIKDLLLVGPLAKEVLESVDSSRRHHRPIYRRGAHRTLVTAIEEVRQNDENEGHEDKFVRLLRQLESQVRLTFAQELLRSNIWFASAQTCRHVHGCLPGKPINRRCAVITDLCLH